ncbi:hypothetical protein M426DRAFT_37785, partial [Hypoxylon sp. CI-4A]
TPLHCAAICGHINVIKFLHERGANINARTSHGHLPLHLAVMNGHFEAEVVRALINRGADLNCAGRFGDTPLMYAAWKGQWQLVKVLLNAGADPH